MNLVLIQIGPVVAEESGPHPNPWIIWQGIEAEIPVILVRLSRLSILTPENPDFPKKKHQASGRILAGLWANIRE